MIQRLGDVAPIFPEEDDGGDLHHGGDDDPLAVILGLAAIERSAAICAGHLVVVATEEPVSRYDHGKPILSLVLVISRDVEECVEGIVEQVATLSDRGDDSGDMG
jgi:hypothetical protein